MRYFDELDKKIYLEFCEVGHGLKKLSASEVCSEALHENLLKIISDRGIFSISVESEYGGRSLEWKKSIIALDAVFSVYSNIQLMNYVVTHIGVVHLISRHAASYFKARHLSDLACGNLKSALTYQWQLRANSKNKFSHTYSKPSQFLSIKMLKKKDNIHVYAGYSDFRSASSVSIGKNYCEIANGSNGTKSFYDSLIFKKIMLGVLASRVMGRINTSAHNSDYALFN
ncbi:MAG: hypothetical protein A3F13_09910 [Gammaproteobacteria bacterium RIFCSPHIGHO2_12_FULL_40_19]|nr:MAG: hypothetical protein A3F13_09910 [Gammaproteobacteria bacterium RIFCSPHIGHO2_12_FULL_40_19]